MTIHATTWTSPLGLLTALSDGTALIGLYREGQRFAPARSGEWRCDDARPLFRELRRQVDTFCGGALRQFTLPLAPRGTPFQERVWKALQRLPFGETVSYGELASRIDAPAACRAVGAAVGRNPLLLLLPCHRVLGRDGTLRGFAAGTALKHALLEFERRILRGEETRLDDLLRSTNGEMPCPAALSALPEAGLPAGPLGDGEGVRP